MSARDRLLMDLSDVRCTECRAPLRWSNVPPIEQIAPSGVYLVTTFSAECCGNQHQHVVKKFRGQTDTGHDMPRRSATLRVVAGG